MKRLVSLVIPLLAVTLVGPPAFSAAQPAAAKDAEPAKSPSKTPSLFPDPVIVKGKGVEIRRSQFDARVIRFKGAAAARGQAIPPERAAELDQYILAQLIQNQLLVANVTDADKAGAKATAQKNFEETKTRLGGEESLDRQLKLASSTREEFMKELTEGAATESLIKRELKVTITDEDAKKFYDENPSRFEQPEMVRASHILLATQNTKTHEELSDEKKAAKRKLADDLLKRARAGEDFAKLVKDYSEDSGSLERGGEYTFRRGQMVKEFEAAAFALNTNQVSDIVTTQFGYHIIKLSEKIPAKKVELSKVAAELRDGLAQQAIQKQMPAYIEKLKKEAGIEILDEKLKPKETADSTATPAAPAPAPAANKSDKK